MIDRNLGREWNQAVRNNLLKIINKEEREERYKSKWSSQEVQVHFGTVQS